MTLGDDIINIRYYWVMTFLHVPYNWVTNLYFDDEFVMYYDVCDDSYIIVYA